MYLLLMLDLLLGKVLSASRHGGRGVGVARDCRCMLSLNMLGRGVCVRRSYEGSEIFAGVLAFPHPSSLLRSQSLWKIDPRGDTVAGVRMLESVTNGACRLSDAGNPGRSCMDGHLVLPRDPALVGRPILLGGPLLPDLEVDRRR